MHKILINIIFLFVFVCQVNGQTIDNKLVKIKLKNKHDSSMVHFQNGNYIISFNFSDLQKIFNQLDVAFELEKKDTTEFMEFIKKIDSTGKGNQTNDYKLNLMLRELIDKGKVSIYCLSKNYYVRTIFKQVDNVPAAGKIYYYFDQKNTIIQFSEAHIGAPKF